MKVPCPFFCSHGNGADRPERGAKCLSPRILEHFIALGLPVGKWNDLPVEVGVFHQTVAQVQQVGIGKPQLSGYRTGAFTFEEAPEDRDHTATAPLCPLELRSREHIEIGGTVIALELDDRLSGIGVRTITLSSTTGTGERSVMKVGQQPVIAFVLIHELFYWEFHLSFFTKITFQ